MAKFVSITQKAFASLISKAKKSGALALVEKIGRNTQPGSGTGITSTVQKEANSRGRVVLPRNDFKNLSRAAGLGGSRGEFVKGMGEARSVDGEIRVTRGKTAGVNPNEYFKRREVSKRGRIESRESKMYQRPDGTFGATSGGPRRMEGTRELDDIALASQRRQDREAQAKGKKLNRTRYATRRTLEEDKF
jgi:hypothetical protein